MKKLLTVVLIMVSICFMPITVGADGGGQADVKGNITFFEETSQSTSSSEKPIDSSTSKPTSNEKKGYSVLPKTGEIIKTYGLWIVLVVVGIIILILLKRKRGNNNE